MLCSSCRRTLLSRVHPSLSLTPVRRRQYAATAPATPNAAPVAPASIAIDRAAKPPPPSRPLAPPHMPSPSTSTSSAKPSAEVVKEASETPKSRPKSSIAGGVELRGLGYTKAKPRINALEDDEYPSWLWTLLDTKKTGSGEAAPDLSAMTKKQRARYDRKMEKLRSSLPKVVPVHEQSNDLTGPDDDAITSLQRRQEITKSARGARRLKIRENNFLKSM